MKSANPDPKACLQALKLTAGKRKTASLEIVNSVCEQLSAQNVQRISIAKVGKISNAHGGPGEQAIRNKGGGDYRALIRAWDEFHRASRSRPSNVLRDSADDVESVANRIDDPALRSLVSSLLAENRRLKGEVALLKKTKILRFQIVEDASEVISEEHSPLLSEVELASIKDAVSERTRIANDWTFERSGRIRNASGRTVFKPGFVSALKTIIESCE